MADLSHIEIIALSLTMAQVAEILTYADEPELLIEPCEGTPIIAADLIAAARLADAMFEAKFAGRH